MNLSESYKKRLQELADIEKLPQQEVQRFNEIVEAIIERVPSLKQYEKFDKEKQDLLSSRFKRQENYGEKIIATKDKMVHFKDYYIFSELVISYRHFNDFKWYYFTFKNELLPILDEKIETDKIFNKVFMTAIRMTNDNFLLSKEIRIPEEEEISQQEIDLIVEEINKATFVFQDYLTNYLNIEFFE